MNIKRVVFASSVVTLTCFVVFLTYSFFSSNIKKIDSILQVQEELQFADENTLIVFDMDDTLIAPKENMFYLLFRDTKDFDISDIDFVKELLRKTEEIASSKHDPNYFNKMTAAVFSKTDFVPVEEATIEIVKKLQNRNVKVIALSSSNTGKFFEIESMQRWRLSNLNQVGLDFSNSFNISEIVFKEIPPQFGLYPPVYYKGILCAAGNPKGKILSEFLGHIRWKPRKIIFFDDAYSQSKSVEKEMKKLGLAVQSYLYRAAFKNKIKLNQKIVTLQFDHWVKYEKFLPEREIK